MPYLHPPPPPSSTAAALGGIVDPLAPQGGSAAAPNVPLTHTQYGQEQQQGPTPPTSTANTSTVAATGGTYNTSPTGVTDMQLLPSWVDATNPPQWYNDGSDIDTLLEDADCLNWLSDTGDLDETYPPAMVEPAAVVSSSSSSTAVVNVCNIEPNPVGVVTSTTSVQQDPTGGVVHPSTDSLSFLMDPPPSSNAVAASAQPDPTQDVVEDVNQLPTFLEETEEEEEQAQHEPTPPAAEFTSATEALATTDATSDEQPGSTANENEGDDDALKLAGVGESDTNLMGFPDLDMGDESAFVSALLENSGQSTMSFPKLNSALDISNNDQSSGALNSSTEEDNVEVKVEEK